MRTIWLITLTTILSLAGVAFAADDTSKDELEQRTKALNRAAEKESLFKQALHHVSIETGVPESTVETQHRRNPDMGLAGIMNANVLAAETKKDPSEFIKQRKAGKGWAAIARANNVTLDKLRSRLDNLDRAIGGAARKGDDNTGAEKQEKQKQKQKRDQ
jgi:hypothetical protein